MTTQSPPTTAQLQHQLQELMDRTAITDLINRQSLWLDEKRFDDARSIFTEDATVQTPGGSARGIENLVHQARRNHAPFQQLQHVTTNVLIELDGDRAAVRANLIATFVPGGDSADSLVQLGERYHFEAVRTPHGWRLSRIQVTPVWKSATRSGG